MSFGSKARSVCFVDGKTVTCVSRPLKAGVKLTGGARTVLVQRERDSGEWV
ncbi:MAG: hypothetical protein MJD61_17715 [Proteobacteria bacterium]|nr:hypothetical protein [Pseudomonadota bacterium]